MVIYEGKPRIANVARFFGLLAMQVRTSGRTVDHLARRERGAEGTLGARRDRALDLARYPANSSYRLRIKKPIRETRP
jgi:hypothetical protein